jgi:arylformamidase
MSRIIDVSLPIGPDLLTWPGDPGIRIDPAKRIDRGDSANVSELHLGSHTGTHVDPPFHFLPGERSIDQLDLDVFLGPAVVADLGDAEAIGSAELKDLELPQGTERLLCRTRNSQLWTRLPADFPDDYVAVTEDGARWLVEHAIRLVGVDFLSVEKSAGSNHPVHRALLGEGTVIVEGLDLSRVEPGSYTLACFPLRITGGDGSPARAVLFEP